jgi:acyl carrier protein
MEKNLDTKLFGSESELDSLGLVGLIVDIEESINSNYNISISIADEKAMSLKNSPFKNIETLSDYILELTKLKIN